MGLGLVRGVLWSRLGIGGGFGIWDLGFGIWEQWSGTGLVRARFPGCAFEWEVTVLNSGSNGVLVWKLRGLGTYLRIGGNLWLSEAMESRRVECAVPGLLPNRR